MKRQYLVKTSFDYRFHNGHAIQNGTANVGDIVEVVRSQVYVTTSEERIHTIEFPWVVSKASNVGQLEEII